MTVIDKMRARLADPQADHGTPCQACGTSAVACQLTYLETDEQQHCCVTCRKYGARQTHR